MRDALLRLLGRMSVGRKLMLIYALDLSAVIFVSVILINEKYIAIDFARKEVQGNAYVTELRQGLLAAARMHQRAAQSDALGESLLARLAHAERLHGEGLQSARPSESFIDALRALAAAPPRQHEAAVRRAFGFGRELVTRIGNQSNLILDPDLDSYYTMSLVLLRYPELLEVTSVIGARLARPSNVAEPAGDASYLALESRLDTVLVAIGQDHAEAITAGPPGLRRQLEPPLARLDQAVQAFRQAARVAITEQSSAAALATAGAAEQALLAQLEMSWTAGSQALNGLLEARIDGLFRRMWQQLGVALALLLGLLTVVTVVARSISRPLRHLADVADTVRRTGDHDLRAHWRSEDEIGRLVTAFNEMLGMLDIERERQKDLAASARAAEAQRELVLATPIALVVTAVPGHEVLHANSPAQDWLHGETRDPWRSGLEHAVRVRLFQQLADRGAVDQFEVRWRLGNKPSWALLSARRIRFQGSDAVLVAFSRIDHLKMMERRLELWAKVFQASSEGILIVNAQQEVLAVNRAFERATGYETQDLIGQRPDERLVDPDQQAQADRMWSAVARRGQWSGELNLRRRDGECYPAWVIASAVPESDGSISHTIVISVDISDRKEAEARIRFLAEHDVLTGLANRALCVERARAALQQARRGSHQAALLFIDLDRFKNINDSLGHAVGDGLLQSVGQRLQGVVREGDTVARLGGDEFVVVLSQVHSVEEVAHVVEQRLIPAVRAPHAIDGSELEVSCSVGIAMFPDDAADIDTLMKHADAAMYQAKAASRDTSRFFSAEMTARAQQRLQLEAELRRAVEQRQFELYWQPRVDAQRGTLAGVEALLRWRHPERGIVGPADFIAVLEETRLIVPLGRWVIDEACAQAADWRDAGLPYFGISLNLSALQLREGDLADHVAGCLARNRLSGGQLELELTESMVMSDAEGHLAQMHALRALGAKLAIDDFGTGYSSLAYLNRLPIDKLKIDRSFVHRMLVDPTDRAITLAVIGLGHTLGLKVVAEGVEREAEASVLRDAMCDELQGYLFGRPMPAAELAGWIRSRTSAGQAPSAKPRRGSIQPTTTAAAKLPDATLSDNR